MKLRTITYKRHAYFWDESGPHTPTTTCTGTLLTFIYDIPYFAACGICPPFHIMNQAFSSGGDQGGMGSGTTWKPFTISIEEYAALVEAIKGTPLSEIASGVDFNFSPMKFDSLFDHIQDRTAWFAAVCAKHRESYHAELDRVAKSSSRRKVGKTKKAEKIGKRNPECRSVKGSLSPVAEQIFADQELNDHEFNRASFVSLRDLCG
jgi:hypothetical protein